MKELIIMKCDSCGSLVKVLRECKCESDCGIACCGKKMRELKNNEVDASFEKHIPTYTVENDIVNIKVNHVMESEHYIEWICVLTEKSEKYFYFNPGDTPECSVEYEPNMKVYSYCNKHALWSCDVE